jgi:hypothetical protein
MVFESKAAATLTNWRLPFLQIETDFETSTGSTSRMFWDVIDSGELFDSALWMKNSPHGLNYWLVEPAVSCGIVSPESAGYTFFHGGLFNEIRFVNVTARHMLHVDSRYDDDPYYPAHPERFLRGRIEEATLQVDWKYGFFRLGRQNRNWGPFPDRSLLVSSNPYTFDAVEFGLFSDYFEFRHLFAPFSSNRSSIDSDGGASLNRYLTAHSLNFIFGKWVTFGITETVLFTRQDAMPDLQYINPLSIYSVVNTNYEGNGNLMLGFQWIIHPGIEALSIRGQLVFDDFQVDDKIATDKEPTHWGIDAGIYWSDPFPGCTFRHLLKLEGAHASKWLYTVPDANAANGERYIVNRRSLGLPANDDSKISAGFVILPKRCFAGEFLVSFEKKGGNTPLTSWGDNRAVQGLPVDTYMPVEKRISVGIRGLYHFKNYCDFNGYGDLGWRHNKDNVRSDGYMFDPSVAIECSIHFCDSFVKLR